jgi:hypothetical protein
LPFVRAIVMIDEAEIVEQKKKKGSTAYDVGIFNVDCIRYL